MSFYLRLHAAENFKEITRFWAESPFFISVFEFIFKMCFKHNGLILEFFSFMEGFLLGRFDYRRIEGCFKIPYR